MKTIEIRRHSIRTIPGDHLNQTGVSLARMVGENLGPFDRVITSTLPRAFETAIAMGFAVDEQNELMSTYGSEVGTRSAVASVLCRICRSCKQGRGRCALCKSTCRRVRQTCKLSCRWKKGIGHQSRRRIGIGRRCLSAERRAY